MKRILTLLLALTLLTIPVQAAETDSDQVYCFSAEDFTAEEALRGICITALPASHTGTVLLGSRVVQPGDILTAEQVARLTFHPVRSEQDATAQLTYLPIYDGRVAPSATMTLSIRGKEDKAPVAQDFTLETYKNLPAQSALKVSDPEGESLTYTVTREPRRGTLEVHADGTFTYTPKRNKVGVDSFTYTAADPAGKVSREATVTIQILKSTDDARYSDTAQFEAEWLRQAGVFQGEKFGNQLCFQPDKGVSREEFLAMAMRLFAREAGESQDLPTGTVNENVPSWLRPYYAAALRSGFLTDFPTDDLASPITPQEAATLLQNLLEPEAPAEETLAVLQENGLLLCDGETLTRADAATLLYQLSQSY